MGECMEFPKTPQEFIKQYEFKDNKEEYTNGAMLIPSFRVEQMVEHYMGEWISVKDRLPNTSKKVLAYCYCKYSGGYTMAVCICHNGFWFMPTSAGTLSFPQMQYEVTHWQPLPEPPKEREV